MAGWRERPWRHHDPDLPRQAERGWQRAVSEDWQGNAGSLARELQGYLVFSAYLQARLGGHVVQSASELAVRPVPSGDPERRAAQEGLHQTLVLLERVVLSYDSPPSDDQPEWTTDWGLETGALPALAVVAVVAVAAVGVGYVAHRAATVIDRELQRRAALAQVLHADAEVQHLVDQHVQREDRAGHQLPLDGATTQALAGLQQRQQQLVIEPPKPADAGGEEWTWAAIGLAAVLAVSKGNLP